MEDRFTSVPLHGFMQKLLGGGKFLLRRRAPGLRLWGFAVPAFLFILEDITRPDGIIIPLCKWAWNKTARVKVIEVSAHPFKTSA